MNMVSVALLKIPVKTFHGHVMQLKQINGLIKGICFPEKDLTFDLKYNENQIHELWSTKKVS